MIHILLGFIEQQAFDAATHYSSAKGQRRKREKCNWDCKSRSNTRKLLTKNGLLLETAFVRVNIPRNIFLEMYMPIKSLK